MLQIPETATLDAQIAGENQLKNLCRGRSLIMNSVSSFKDLKANIYSKHWHLRGLKIKQIIDLSLALAGMGCPEAYGLEPNPNCATEKQICKTCWEQAVLRMINNNNWRGPKE